MALVLTRRKGEGIDINGPAVVTVSRCGRGSVSLRIEAPLETRIVRLELTTGRVEDEEEETKDNR